ncbi:ExeM/NucH family extracellular endonuclease [Ornithinimicrobium tianjinense]|uniref:Nuclease n=1 Tax=Ornithinimicrobium tianjinense TaxID=1195761 RepID=A0A917BNI4_9MICO|nr:ExeM/NucH family extracellular endonuclease [Ornithinimicrobium tianjinense]GGF50820.1 nuclease [Ornithinimicrobium tianjinense]
MTLTSRARRGLAATAAASLSLAGLVSLAPLAGAAGPGLVVDEVYGGGGNSGATYTHDFVELHNTTTSAVSVDGFTVKYYSASGNLGNTCTLSGSVAAGSRYLVQQAKGSGGTTALPTPDATCSATMSGTSGSVVLSDATGAVLDTVGYGTASLREGTAAPALTNTTSASRTDGVDTDDNSADFTVGTPMPQNSGGATPPDDPGPVEATIAQIQGTGAASPLVGQEVITSGVVTATYPTGGFNGVYLQTPGTGGAAKAAGEASDGVFVYSGWMARNLQVGDCVSVEATVEEYRGLTELTDAFATEITGCEPVEATQLAGVPAADADKEPYEGMLVLPQGTYTITNNYQLNQYGQLGLVAGEEPLYQATEVVEPGPAALAYEADNQRRLITLDDGSSWDYMRNTDAKESPLPYLSATEPMRTASQVTFEQPVILDYRFQWNYQPTGQVVGATDEHDPLVTENDREVDVPEAGGNIQMAAFNVLNYFTDLGMDEEGCDYYADMYGDPVATNYCEVRGAWDEDSFVDQKAKILAAIGGLDAEVVALMEIENSAGISYVDHHRDWTLAELVSSLNAAEGSTRWAYAESPVVVPENEDVIRTAFIYDRTAVQALGASVIQLDDAFANARYPLAQQFKALNTGRPFTAVANHFKSKGSGEDDGTGQGLANPSREAQAAALTSWVEEMFGDEATFLLGDFNAYSKETPVQIIEDAGYTNVVKQYEPTSASYQFSGRLGSLDHVFANAEAMRLVTGAGIWDINGDESIAFQYSRRLYNVVDFYAPDQFASSDHDPAVVGLDTGSRGRGGRG